MKEEFLRELQEALDGELSYEEIQENLSYYRSYIEDEVRNGKTEEEVIRSLGSGRLIARTLIDAKLDGKDEPGHYYGEREEAGQEVSYDENNKREHPEIQERKDKIMHIIRTVVVGVLIVAAIAVALHVFVALLPLIAILVVVGMIWRRIM